MNNLPEIRDIQIPEGVSIFPLAYGWWVVLGIIITLIIAIKITFWVLQTSKKLYTLKILRKIDTHSPVDAAILMSELLRRVCNLRYKSASVLYGKEWIDFLEKTTEKKLSEKASNLLVYAPFMKKKQNKYDRETADELKEFCKTFIGVSL